MAPPGGEKDSIPPYLIETIPANSTVHFKGGRVELIFSEYLDVNTIKKGIHVLPNFSEPLEIIYKGKKVFIEFPDSLPKNQTYIIILNRNLADEHKVKISEGIQVAFSTGDEIDGGSIKGKVFHSKPASVNLWKIKNNLDQNQFYKRVPDYVIDCAESGDYEIRFLSEGTYRIVAVDQSVSGIPIDPDHMIYGLNWISKLDMVGQKQLDNINIRIPQNKESLKMIRAEHVKGKWGQITFSGDISDMIENISLKFFYKDSIMEQTEFFQDPLNKKKLNFTIDKQIEDYISIYASTLNNDGNAVIDSGLIRIKMDSTIDTTSISIIYPTSNYIMNIEQDSIVPLRIALSSFVSYQNNTQPFMLIEDSIAIEFETLWESPLSVALFPIKNWKPKKSYVLKIKQNSIFPIYGKGLMDSIITIPFKTSSYRNFGSLVIKPEGKFFHDLTVELIRLEKEPRTFRTNVNSLGIININQLPEGDYDLFFFQDSDRNNRYSMGNIDPFKPSEWFQNYSDTIKIRGNWEFELKKIKLERN